MHAEHTRKHENGAGRLGVIGPELSWSCTGKDEQSPNLLSMSAIVTTTAIIAERHTHHVLFSTLPIGPVDLEQNCLSHNFTQFAQQACKVDLRISFKRRPAPQTNNPGIDAHSRTEKSVNNYSVADNSMHRHLSLINPCCWASMPPCSPDHVYITDCLESGTKWSTCLTTRWRKDRPSSHCLMFRSRKEPAPDRRWTIRFLVEFLFHHHRTEHPSMSRVVTTAVLPVHIRIFKAFARRCG